MIVSFMHSLRFRICGWGTGGRTIVRPSVIPLPSRHIEGERIDTMLKFVQWQVYSMAGGDFAISNLRTTLRIKSKRLALKVAADKNSNKRMS